MPIYKCTMVFLGRKHGWTESWWQSNSETDYQNPMDQLQSLADKRAKLLGQECKIEALRVSLEGTAGDGFLKYVNIPGVAQKSAAEHDVAVLVTVRNQLNTRRKHAFLRGIWDDAEAANGDYIKDLAGWKDNMSTFLKSLTATAQTAQQWGWYGVDVKTKKNVTGYTVDANNRVTFTVADPIFDPLDVNKMKSLRLTGLNGKSSMNGVYVCQVLSTTTCITRFPYKTVPYKFGGTMQDVTKTFIKIYGADDQRITSRKVGSPLLASRGHAKGMPHD